MLGDLAFFKWKDCKSQGKLSFKLKCSSFNLGFLFFNCNFLSFLVFYVTFSLFFRVFITFHLVKVTSAPFVNGLIQKEVHFNDFPIVI